MEQDRTIGDKIYALAERLFPICRSITGEGVRQTLRVLQEHIPLKIQEVPSGTAVLDWTIPREWNIRDAWIKDESGNYIVHFKDHNLHVLGYSVPIHKKLDLKELKEHLYSLPDQPDLIPYRTSYYQENWGFCLAHQQLENLREGTYEVFIDSDLESGYLTYGEYLIPGRSEEIILLSAHCCHPSLANDNLSGIGILTYLAKMIGRQDNRYSYLFLFAPGTIGAITWLAHNLDKTKLIRHGLVVSLLGDGGPVTYKKSRRETAEMDQVAEYVLQQAGLPYQLQDFAPYGYDERQFCSPGFNLPVGSLSRSPFGTFPEYHTSADNLTFIRPECLAASFRVIQRILQVAEENYYFQNLRPMGEPQLGKTGLYQTIGGRQEQQLLQMAILWTLNYSDGSWSLLDIAKKSNIPFDTICAVSRLLMKHKLLAPIRENDDHARQ